MRFGLDDSVVEKLTEVFEANPKVDKAYIFGSRAKGNFRADSDIDIAIKGYDLTLDDILKMSVAFEDKGISNKIDLLDYNEVKEPALIEHIDRIGVEFYSRWKEVKLGDICTDINYGYTASANDQPVGPKFLRITDIVPQRINWETVPYCKISASEFKKNKLERGDIVIARTGATTGFNYMFNDNVEAVFASYLIRYRINQLFALPEFINYSLKSELWKGFVEGIIGGSAQPGANAKMFAEFKLKSPPISEQKTISEIARSLDNKIDLLHRQNKTLEQLAETLFRQWFVEEAEENWEVEPLGKVFDIGIGRTPPRKEQHWFTLDPNDIKWASIKDMGTSGLYIDHVSEYLTQEAIDKFSIPLIPENTVLLSFKMTIGRLAISTGPMVSNEAIAHFKQKENSFLFPEFLYLFLAIYEWEQLGSTSSIVEAINSQMIKGINMIIPDKEKLLRFKNIIKPYFNKIKSNQTQIQSLTKMRDTLLPKLMSGEVRVKMQE